jgi:hypothetical protein
MCAGFGVLVVSPLFSGCAAVQVRSGVVLCRMIPQRILVSEGKIRLETERSFSRNRACGSGPVGMPVHDEH